MSVSAVGSGAGHVPYVTPQVTAAAEPTVAKSQALDSDGDHDGSSGSSGRLDTKA